MQFEEFESRLKAKHPQAEARKTARGLDVVCVPEGRVYRFFGTFISIAEEMRLVEKWYIYQSGVVCGLAHSEEEAKVEVAKLEAEDRELAETWNVLCDTFSYEKVSG